MPRRRGLVVVALAFGVGTIIVACGDPATDEGAAEPEATATTAWNDLPGLGTAPSLSTTNTSEPTPPTGSLVADTTDVRVLWSFPANGVEFVAVHDGVVYVTTDTQIVAASLADGTVAWRHTSDDYFSDGDSRLAIDGDELWVVAPYNSNIRLDRATGRTLRIDDMPASELPTGFTALAAPAPNSWTVTNSLDGAQAVLPDGRPAWQLVVQDDGYAEGGPVVAEGEVTIVPAADGTVYAITTA